MIPEFVAAWDARKSEVQAVFEAEHPESYIDVVRAVVAILGGVYGDWGESPDVSRIHEIDDGEYQGTLVYIIGASGYQPADYWWVMIDYGSCSGCDTLASIRSYGNDPPTADQVAQYMTLALHIIQKLKKLNGEIV